MQPKPVLKNPCGACIDKKCYALTLCRLAAVPHIAPRTSLRALLSCQQEA